MSYLSMGNNSEINTHSHVSAAKKDMRHTSVLFTRITKSPFSAPHTYIFITTVPISIKFTYFMPSVYMTLTAKFEENQISSLQDIHF